MTKNQVRYNPFLHGIMTQLIALENNEQTAEEIAEEFLGLLAIYLITAKPGLTMSSKIEVRGEMFMLRAVSILRVVDSYPEFQLIDTEGNVWLDVTLDEISVI